jgi:uncharacterized protein (DUF952 family)
MPICHILSLSDWKKAREEGSYQPPSLQQEGFIHFSTPQQVIKTANRFYAQQTDLCLLLVDENQLVAELRFENTEGVQEAFPHLYGPLNLESVLDIQPLTLDPQGSFQYPPAW